MASSLPMKKTWTRHVVSALELDGLKTAINVSVKEEKAAFDSKAANSLVKQLRANFAAGKTRSYDWRMGQLRGILKILDNHESEIVAALRSDLSKPVHEAFINEIINLQKSCKLAIKKLKEWMTPEKVPISLALKGSAEIVPEPLGVVLIISTWNFPLLLSLDPVVGAVAAGNSVVLKPSELAPVTSSLLAKLVSQYLDRSCVRVVEGAVPETTALLEQKWDKIFYTGSGRIGRTVMAAAAKHLTPVVLELGGKCPVVVDPDADIKVTARRIAIGKWGCNNGQACIAPDYIITTKDFAPKLVDTFREVLQQIFGRSPLNSKDLSRIVNSNHFDRLTKLMDEDKVSGKIVHGGERDKTKLKIAPTIFLDVPHDSLIMNEEIFGPLLPIITVDKVEDSFDLINSSGRKPLAAYLFTSNEELKKQFVASVSSGGQLVNDTVLHVAVQELPFGGVGESGMGSYHGKFSFDAFSHKKPVLSKY
uniref:Aldehyde dehydrogenase n=1 Tax=Bixa orellana TaxID=66672 RepID=A0A140CWT4_BIXOR|nr:aldehyde dehydrogenase H1 copy 1 isoform [Bixa orellana]